MDVGLRLSGVGESNPFWGNYDPTYHTYTIDVTGTGQQLEATYVGYEAVPVEYALSRTIARLTPIVWLTPETVHGAEDGRSPASIAIHRAGSGADAMDVYFRLAGSATKPGTNDSEDYSVGATAVNGSGLFKVHLAAGESTRVVEFTPLNDSDWTEDTESIELTLEPAPFGEALFVCAGGPANAAVEVEDIGVFFGDMSHLGRALINEFYELRSRLLESDYEIRVDRNTGKLTVKRPRDLPEVDDLPTAVIRVQSDTAAVLEVVAPAAGNQLDSGDADFWTSPNFGPEEGVFRLTPVMTGDVVVTITVTYQNGDGVPTRTDVFSTRAFVQVP